MDKMRVAVATDDGKTLMGRHFGDAGFYEVFDVYPAGCEAVQRIMNDLDEREDHAGDSRVVERLSLWAK